MPTHHESLDLSELRRSPRVLVRRPVQVRNQSVTMMYAISTDVSEHGLGILASQALKIGQRCTFSFEVTTGGIQSTITVDGTVCYNRPVAPRGIRTGVSMLKAHPSSVGPLERFLRP